MVAYGFKPMFCAQIEAGLKQQTVRANRKRHARPNEFIQLYRAMRTKHCRKIVADPVCTQILPVVIDIATASKDGVSFIELDGTILHPDEIGLFAIADGFLPMQRQLDVEPGYDGVSARRRMQAFWLQSHGEGRFEGVAIYWKPV